MKEYLTREEQKDIAIKRMKQLNIYKPYIDRFQKDNTVTMFERFAGFWATANNGFEELENEVKEYEKGTGSLVYAITHEIFEFGDCYTFLTVSNYREDELEIALTEYCDEGYVVFAYVWNKTHEEFSEYGSVVVQSAVGGIRRVA